MADEHGSESVVETSVLDTMTRKSAGIPIEWTEQAVHQLDQAYDYIALSNSEEVAVRVTARIVAAIQQLATFPMSGRTGRVSGTRELVIATTPFLAAYAIDVDRIVILAIYHGAQKWPDAF